VKHARQTTDIKQVALLAVDSGHSPSTKQRRAVLPVLTVFPNYRQPKSVVLKIELVCRRHIFIP